MKTIRYREARGPEDLRLYAVGDVHGRLDLLQAMHERIADDLQKRPAADCRIIHLGDYTDRGPDSKGVLDFLVARSENDSRHIALMGNHDEGLLEFLATADRDGLFAGNGGEATGRSYGVEIDFSSDEDARAGRDALLEAMPEAHIAFLSSLPRSIAFGDFFFCHAGIRPGVPLDRQDPWDLAWIRWDFLDHTGLYEKVIVHGHTPVARPDIQPNRIDIDTGAFKTGRLTALVIDGGKKTLIEVSDSQW
ncbi:MAG TPA: metallophosphoesterase family protein [Rhizobiaceae bacterium]|nr:metallophosphoesterase family protein [Rhizobiaceae bacterium]